MSLNESAVEEATLEWFGALGYAVGHGPQLAPGEVASERDSFSDVVLAVRLREAIRRLNPHIPEDARQGTKISTAMTYTVISDADVWDASSARTDNAGCRPTPEFTAASC